MTEKNTKLRVEVLPPDGTGVRKFKLLQELWVGGQCAPGDFESDIVTAPWWLRWFVPQFDNFAEEAVIHDHLIKKHNGYLFANQWFNKQIESKKDLTSFKKWAIQRAVKANAAKRMLQ